VASFAARWMRDFPTGRGGIRSESTVLHNNERVRSFVDDFGPRKLSDVSRLEARAWILGGRVPDQIAEIAAGWQGAERRDGGVFVPDHKGNRSVVRSMYSDAANDGLVRENPFAGMRLEQSKGRAGITVLTEKELQQLLAVAVEEHGPEFGPRYAAMIQFAAWSGMRPAEIYALRWGKIDFQGNRIRVDSQYSSKTGKYGLPKSQKPRTIALTPGAREALMALPRAGAEDLVFRTKGDRPYMARSHHMYWDPVRRAFTSSCRRATICGERLAKDPEDRLDFYELRHFCATYLYETLKLPAHVVAVQLGHQDGGKLVMETYGHPSEFAALDSIDAAFEEAAERRRRRDAGLSPLAGSNRRVAGCRYFERRWPLEGHVTCRGRSTVTVAVNRQRRVATSGFAGALPGWQRAATGLQGKASPRPSRCNRCVTAPGPTVTGDCHHAGARGVTSRPVPARG
jgi:integrase